MIENGFPNIPWSDSRRRPSSVKSRPHPSILLLIDHPLVRNPIGPASNQTVINSPRSAFLTPTPLQRPVPTLQPHPTRLAPLFQTNDSSNALLEIGQKYDCARIDQSRREHRFQFADGEAARVAIEVGAHTMHTNGDQRCCKAEIRGKYERSEMREVEGAKLTSVEEERDDIVGHSFHGEMLQ